ncbi:patatin-like phospholipase family protein, partial [Bacteroidota bacterium]
NIMERVLSRFFIILIFCLFLSSKPAISDAQQDSSLRPKVGLILSGGGAKGIAHIGVLKVLEEAGLKIDFIGGTSVGSIVGGLYAIGYDAESLQKIVLTRNWDRLLSDEISRRDLSIEEKPDYDRFFVSIPLKERKVKLPAGMITGQNIEKEFAELCAHMHNSRDFAQFQIPYLCVATDVETGQEKVFREGYLPSCMSASMAIPTVFAPIEIEGKLYIDGGVVNNFPVDHVKEMGADILIGVDVGFTPRTAKDEMNLLQIMEQTVFMASHSRMEKNRALCDIYIKPDLSGYNASSFNSGDTLIARGQRAALPFLDQFRQLADSINAIEYLAYEPPSFIPVDSLFLREINVDGINKVSGKLVTGKMNLNVLERVAPSQISKAISDVYSSLFFEKVTYELEPLSDELLGEGVRLRVKVRERKGGQLKVGLHYNNTHKASILLNTTFRNLLLNGSKTSLNLALGENPFVMGRFEKNNGWKPGFVVEIGGQDLNLDLYDRGSRYAVIDYSDVFGRFYTQSIINNSNAIGIGGEFERIRLKPEIGDPFPETLIDNFYNLIAFINFDTYDNRFYPRKGTRFDANFKFINGEAEAPEWFMRANMEQALSIGRKFTIIPRLYGGSTSADSNLQVYHFYLGGLDKESIKGLLPFVGLNFMERSGRNALVAGLDLQYNIWKSNYLILKANFANTSYEPADLLLLENVFSGFGITYGNHSLIGPIELTLMRPGYRKGVVFYVNLGYHF